MDTDIIFETKNLTKKFGALVAVDDVNIRVQKNSLHAIIGPNGAGKTTFFNLLAEILNRPVDMSSSKDVISRTSLSIARSISGSDVPSRSRISSPRSLSLKIFVWLHRHWEVTTSSSGKPPRTSNDMKNVHGMSSKK